MRLCTPLLVPFFAGSLIALSGCEESGSGSAATPSNQGGAQSQLGKSVEMGKDLRSSIQGRDMALGALAGGEGVLDVGPISIPIPASWTEVTPANTMRLAQYEADGGEVVIVVSQAGGSTDANIERWSGQVKDNGQPAEGIIEEFTVSGYDVTTIDLTGDYTAGGMGGTPTTTYNDYSFVGAVIDTGATKTFIKMTGPFSLVGDHLPMFENMIHGIQKN